MDVVMKIARLVCLIGVSGYGAVHYHDLLRLHQSGEVILAAATVINPDEESEKCGVLRSIGCRIYQDYRDMLAAESGISELCLIPTGIGYHCEMTCAALTAGMHVLVEKPAAAVIQDVRRMQETERRTGRFVAVGYQAHYSDATLRLKELLLSGTLGKIERISCAAYSPRGEEYYTRNSWAGRLWVGDRWILDSPLHNAFSHHVNMLTFLAGETLTTSVSISEVEGELYGARGLEAPDTAGLRVKTPAGISMQFAASHRCASAGGFARIHCSEGDVYWSVNSTRIIRKSGPAEEWQHELDRDVMLSKVLHRIDDPSAPVCSLEVASVPVLCINGMHESSPVRPIPADAVSVIPDGEYRETVVPGIESACRDSADQGLLFSELSLPWAQPGKVVGLRDYREFPKNVADLNRIHACPS